MWVLSSLKTNNFNRGVRFDISKDTTDDISLCLHSEHAFKCFSDLILNKMYLCKEETEIRNLVTFYTMYTCIYFPLLVIILLWTGGIYSAGKYHFNSVISLIITAELLKYFSSALYFKSYDVNLSKKYDAKRTGCIIKRFLTKTKIREGFKNVIAVFIMIFIYFIIAILYGAEVLNNYEETFMFSSLLSVLTIFPACLNLGSQSVTSLVLGSKPINNVEELIYQTFYMTVFGAWLGAFVIPLDWDRSWQVWPIPCSFGAMVGYGLSHFLMLFKVKIGLRKKSKRHF